MGGVRVKLTNFFIFNPLVGRFRVPMALLKKFIKNPVFEISAMLKHQTVPKRLLFHIVSIKNYRIWVAKDPAPIYSTRSCKQMASNFMVS